MLDYNSLLLSAALSGLCLAGTLLAIRLLASGARFVATNAVGIVILVLHVVAFWRHSVEPWLWLGALSHALLIAGILIVCCGARQAGDDERYGVAAAGALAGAVTAVTATCFGFDGVGFIVTYVTVTALLAHTALALVLHAKGSRWILRGVALLATVCAISFGLCGFVLLANRQWTLGTAPDNWAERANIVVTVSALTILGAFTMALQHTKLQGKLKTESVTDPLTGLKNRRALMDFYGARGVAASVAVVMFDLDHFKRTNDIFGHAVGDMVLRRFAAVIRDHARPDVEAFRLGGEEFALVISGNAEAEAKALADQIADAFSADVVLTPLGPLSSTVSGGLAFAREPGTALDDMLAKADAALYEAKRGGRGRVMTHTGEGRTGDAGPARRSA